MTPKIKILPAEMVDKIAAGEVIERPASVLKELVENSLDAGSSVVTVEIEEGGRKRIMVMDDGEGMTREDALLAIERYATSKVYEEGDLEAIRTLGFRGEALPSIAAVSRLRLITRTRDELSGTQIVVEGGQVRAVEEIGSPPGTRIEVADLFYNLPARRKFLRGVRSELAHCIEVVTRMALIQGLVGFVLKHNNRTLFNLPPTHDERSRIRAILGKEVASQLVRVEGKEGGGTVEGWATVPTYCRGSSKGIYIYVNGRYIRDKLVSHAILEAYRRFIPAKMYPVIILSLSIPFTDVDINVHPAKREVRFRRGDEIHRLVSALLRRALGHPAEAKPHGGEFMGVQEALSPYAAPPVITSTSGEDLALAPQWRMVGQLKGTYLVVEGEEGVMIFDHHAVHERILYEELKAALQGRRIPQQPFLLPQPIELKREEMELLLGHRAALSKVGVELEEFGKRTVVIISIPAFLQGVDLQSLLEALSEELAERGEGDTLEHVLDRVCVLLACQGAIKANRRLQEEEVQSLLKGWEEAGRPTTCPHGRPLLVQWRWGELEGWFRRG
jgi:DNA mismatch repair protein MutL